jgi:RNA polymerase sigma factor (sigma-70 family)
MTTDCDLLRRYAETNSEEAFAELVRRHLDLVYSAALRQVNGDAHLAQDVTQTVFTDLARKAESLSRRLVLTGWLYTSAHFAAAKAVRAERRRRTREQEAQNMHECLHDPTPDLDWSKLRPALDEAMHELKEADREVILLRYFERRQLAEIGARLGVSENTARMRVARAVDKLRTFLNRRGVTLTATTLGTTLATEAVVAAPAGLAVSVTAASLAGAAAAGTGISATLMKFMAMTKVKAGLASALVIVGVATPLTLQHQSLNRMRQENLALRQQTGEITQLREANARLAKLQVDADELERLRKAQAELMQLRGEVASLRGINDELARVKNEKQRSESETKQDANEFVPADKFVDAGLVTLEAAVQTLCYAAFTGNKERYRQAVDWTEVIPFADEQSRKDDPNWTPWFTLAQFPGRFQGFQILSRKLESPDQAEVELATRLKLGNTETRETNRLKFRRIGNEWKFRMISPADVVYFPFDTTINRPDASDKPGESN